MIELLADLVQLSVAAWLVLVLCAGVIGAFAGACIRERR